MGFLKHERRCSVEQALYQFASAFRCLVYGVDTVQVANKWLYIAHEMGFEEGDDPLGPPTGTRINARYAQMQEGYERRMEELLTDWVLDLDSLQTGRSRITARDVKQIVGKARKKGADV